MTIDPQIRSDRQPRRLTPDKAKAKAKTTPYTAILTPATAPVNGTESEPRSTRDGWWGPAQLPTTAVRSAVQLHPGRESLRAAPILLPARLGPAGDLLSAQFGIVGQDVHR